MGCGIGVLAEPLMESAAEEMVKLDKSFSSTLAPLIIKHFKKVAVETFNNKVLVKNRDLSITVGKTGAEGVHEPPNGEALDGLLGITVKTFQLVYLLINSLRSNYTQKNVFVTNSYF